jgi:hypothetical protein
MNTVYVVRELVTAASGEKEFRTHYEYGMFPTYKAADECARATRNQSYFPQREELAQIALDAAAGSTPESSLFNVAVLIPALGLTSAG